MAKTKTYVEYPELKELCETLQARYYEFLGHIDYSKIYFAEILSPMGQRSESVEVYGVSASWLKQRITDEFDEKLYCVAVYRGDWLTLGANVADWLLFEKLLLIHPRNNGKLRNFDTVGWGFMLQHLGPYWMGRDDLPTLREGDIQAIPPPPAMFEIDDHNEEEEH